MVRWSGIRGIGSLTVTQQSLNLRTLVSAYIQCKSMKLTLLCLCVCSVSAKPLEDFGLEARTEPVG